MIPKKLEDVPLEDLQALRRKIRGYEYQQKRLISLFRYDQIAEDQLLDEMGKLKKDREADQAKLADLE